MQDTAINWTDMTWNPASGCEKISPGCKYCYAEKLAEQKRGTRAFPRGFEPMVRPWKLEEPVRVKAPRLVFVNSTSDLFLPAFGHDYRDKVMDVIRRTPWHRYQILTKRPEVALDYVRSKGPLPDNVWMGVTIESDLYTGRADVLRQIPARVRFLSLEPLLGPLPSLDLDGIHWVITGGESGLHLRDPKVAARRSLARRGEKGERPWVPREDRLDWVRDIRDRCAAAGVAFWHKQHGGVRPESGGRLLDGREHNGMPEHVPGAMPGPAKTPVHLPLFGDTMSAS